MLDAYAIRKAVPRIFLAVIGINVSIYLCIAAVDVTNIIGQGVGNLIAGSFVSNDTFGDLQIDNNKTNNAAVVAAPAMAVGTIILVKFLSGTALFATLTGGVPLGALAGIGLVGILIPFVISVFFITMAILFTLIIRQALLVFLVVVAPVAFALSVLPGTEKYFKKWIDLFMKTLIVYPIIAVIFAMSTAMSAILLGTSGDSPGGIGLAKILGALVVAFAPLVMIPFAFKLAGGAISAVLNAAAGAAGNASKGLGQRAGQGWKKMSRDENNIIGKYRQKQIAALHKKDLHSSQLGAGLLGGLTRKRGLNGERESFRTGYDQAKNSYDTTHIAHKNEEIEKLLAAQPVKGNDDLIKAFQSIEGEDGKLRARTHQEKMEFLTSDSMGYSAKDAGQLIASGDRLMGSLSQHEFDAWATQKLPKTGTAYKTGGFDEMAEDISRASHGNAALEGYLMAGARGGASEARRYDLLPGFGTSMTLVKKKQRHARGDFTDTELEAEFEAITVDRDTKLKGAKNNEAIEQIKLEFEDRKDKLIENYTNGQKVTTRSQTLSKDDRETAVEIVTSGGIREYVNAKATDNGLYVQGASAALAGRGESNKHMMPAVMRRLAKSVKEQSKAEKQLKLLEASPDSSAIDLSNARSKVSEKQLNYFQALAMTSALRDVAPQVAPEGAEIFLQGGELKNSNPVTGAKLDPIKVDGILTARIGGRLVTDLITEASTNPVFQSIKYDYPRGVIEGVQELRARSDQAVQLAQFKDMQNRNLQGVNVTMTPGGPPPPSAQPPRPMGS